MEVQPGLKPGYRIGAKNKSIAYLISLTLSFTLHSLIPRLLPNPVLLWRNLGMRLNSAYIANEY